MMRRFPKYAMIGFARDAEKKYLDHSWALSSVGADTGGSQFSKKQLNNGRSWTSHGCFNYSFNQEAPGALVGHDCNFLVNLGQGQTANTRIGNKVYGKYVKGAVTFTAATSKEGSGEFPWQNGERAIEPAEASTAARAGYYARTTFRWCIILDMQVNTNDLNMPWTDVFRNDNLGAGVHAELKIENMGRFRILRDETFELRADCPQVTKKFFVPGSDIGSVRYNGPTTAGYTDKRIFIVYAAFTQGAAKPEDTGGVTWTLPYPVGHSRFCFTDQ